MAAHARRGTRHGGAPLQPAQPLDAALETAAYGAPQALLQLVETLRLLCAACGGAHERRAPLEPAQALALFAETPASAACEPCGEACKGRQPLAGVGDDELGGGRGRRRTQVGGEIGDGEIDLVADAADDGNRGCDDGARQALVVERPQILERAAAAGEDEHVALGPAAGERERRNDLRGRLCALHGDRIDHDRDGGKAPRKHVQDVAHRGAGGRGDDADAPGQRRQRTLALGGEQALRLESRAQLLELALQGAETRILHVLDDELKLAARLVESDAGAHEHFLAVAGGERAQHVPLPEHRAAHLGVRVLQGKIPVSGAWPREIGDLGLDPQSPEAALEQQPHFAVEPRNAVNVALGARGGTGQGFHREIIAVWALARYNAPPLRRT